MSRKQARILITIFCVVLFSCKEYQHSFTTLPLGEILSAPERIKIDDRQYILETYLWRDFMPISPPDGKPLLARIRVTAQDSLPFPVSIDIDRLWVINGSEVWEAVFSEKERVTGIKLKNQLERIARNGPKWRSGIRVDIVVRVIDTKGNAYLLKDSDQLIHRTN